MGVEPYLLSSTVVGILAQRLVRRICPECKTPYEPNDRELQSTGLKREDLLHGHLFQGAGCPACFGSGYKGRHGVYELMLVNNALKKQIVKSPDAVEMRRIALDTGMTSLLAHGSELARQGVTTVAEVLRVTRGVDE
jgi:general secretion pathway protein E